MAGTVHHVPPVTILRPQHCMPSPITSKELVMSYQKTIALELADFDGPITESCVMRADADHLQRLRQVADCQWTGSIYQRLLVYADNCINNLRNFRFNFTTF